MLDPKFENMHIRAFEETDGQVRLLESFETEDQNSAELQKNGWQAILNHFKHYTESLI